MKHRIIPFICVLLAFSTVLLSESAKIVQYMLENL